MHYIHSVSVFAWNYFITIFTSSKQLPSSYFSILNKIPLNLSMDYV